MSRVSRIQHQPGSRFIALHAWAVREFGVAGAAVIGLLDFLDRAHENANQPAASRQRVVAELEYIVGRDQVDHALRTLVAVGAINLHKTTTAGARNLVTRIQYSINPDALNKIISGTPDFRSPGDSCPQEPPGQLQPVLKSGVPYMKKEKEKEKAAALAPECTPSAAVFAKKKRRVVRASGVVVWLLADEQEAERLEQTHDATAISTAVTVLRASGKEPVPGLVSREIERQQRERDTAARRAASDAKQAALAAAPPHELDFASLDYSKLPLRMCEQALRVASKNQ